MIIHTCDYIYISLCVCHANIAYCIASLLVYQNVTLEAHGLT